MFLQLKMTQKCLFSPMKLNMHLFGNGMYGKIIRIGLIVGRKMLNVKTMCSKEFRK